MSAPQFPAKLTTAYAVFARVLADVDRVLPRNPGTLTQQRVLRALLGCPGMVDAELARALGLQSSHLSRVMTQLTQADLVSGQPTPHHVSQRLRYLTALGAERAGVVAQAYEDAAVRQFDLLSADDRAFLINCVAAISERSDDEAPAAATEVRAVRVSDFPWIFEQALSLERHDRRGVAIVARNLMRHASQSEDWDLGWIGRRLDRTVGACLAAFTNDQLSTEISFWYVDPECRGLGLGSQLLSKCIENARRLTAINVTAVANPHSPAGLVLKKHGFVAEKPLRRDQKARPTQLPVRFTLKLDLA